MLSGLIMLGKFGSPESGVKSGAKTGIGSAGGVTTLGDVTVTLRGGNTTSGGGEASRESGFGGGMTVGTGDGFLH